MAHWTCRAQTLPPNSSGFKLQAPALRAQFPQSRFTVALHGEHQVSLLTGPDLASPTWPTLMRPPAPFTAQRGSDVSCCFAVFERDMYQHFEIGVFFGCEPLLSRQEFLTWAATHSVL